VFFVDEVYVLWNVIGR